MNRKYRLLFFLVILISSCTVYKEYPIEILKPGEITVPETAENVTIVYRNFKYPGDTLQHFFKDNGRLVRAKNDPANLDSILVNDCFRELSKQLKEKETFAEVYVLPYNLFNRHYAEKLPDLPAEFIDKIASVTHTDMLISLESFSCLFSRYPQVFEQPQSNEIVTVAVWSFYDLNTKTRLERTSLIDTIYQNGYDNDGNYISGYKLPSRIPAMRLASKVAGENYAKRMHESWSTAKRVYSVPPLPDFSDAAYYFEEGKLDQAISLWKKYIHEKNGKLAINARYNLALAYEMKDELETAQKWLESAGNLANSYNSRKDIIMISYYTKELKKRIMDMRHLK